MVVAIMFTVGAALMVAGVWKEIDKLYPLEDNTKEQIAIMLVFVIGLFVIWGLYFTARGGPWLSN